MVERGDDVSRRHDHPPRLGHIRRALAALIDVLRYALRFVRGERAVEPRVDGSFIKMLHVYLVQRSGPAGAIHMRPPIAAALAPASFQRIRSRARVRSRSP